MADAMFIAAEKIFGKKPDAAFMNYGGIRLNQLKAGVITTGKLYELFPFDNLLVTVTIKGTVFQQFLDHISGRGGWPVSGMTMQIKNGKAVNVLVGGKPLNPEATYSIVVGDYTANGGDEAAMLVGLPQQNKGYLMRDAIIDYFKSFAAAGTTIVVQPENRVTNVE
jgi:2',3'-cyclic-nucleotide 2'-phosphodiesterase (5'-nucleotidase family)